MTSRKRSLIQLFVLVFVIGGLFLLITVIQQPAFDHCEQSIYSATLQLKKHPFTFQSIDPCNKQTPNIAAIKLIQPTSQSTSYQSIKDSSNQEDENQLKAQHVDSTNTDQTSVQQPDQPVNQSIDQPHLKQLDHSANTTKQANSDSNDHSSQHSNKESKPKDERNQTVNQTIQQTSNQSTEIAKRKNGLTAVSTSQVHWLAYGNPLYQNITDHSAQVTELQSVSIHNGKLVFYNQTIDQANRLKQYFETYKHFNGVEIIHDVFDDMVEFDPKPLDWSTCGVIEPQVSFFASSWMPSLSYHVMCDTLLPMYAMLRSANALIKQSNFQSAMKHGPLFQPVDIDPSINRLVDLSHGQMFLFDHLQRFSSSKLTMVLSNLFQNEVKRFGMLRTGLVHCFPRIRWGRGPLLNYFQRTNPFPTKLPILNTAKTPEEAATIEQNDFNRYVDGELGQWFGIVIDFHNYMLHSHGLKRRVRDHRDLNSHEPLPEPRQLVANPNPTVIYVKRNKVHVHDENFPRGRFVANQDVMISRLKAAGMVIIECCNWDESWQTIFRIFQKGDILLGLHGAGLTNLVFLPPGGIVVELQSTYGFETNFFEPLAEHMDHLYLKVDVRQYINGSSGYELPGSFNDDLAQRMLSEWKNMHVNETYRFRHSYPH